MMNGSYVIILIAVSSLISCDKIGSREGESGNKPIQYMIGDWCLFDDDRALQKGDSVLIFGEQRSDENIYALVIRPANKTRYNATYYQGDSLNALYNVVDDSPSPKFFFEAVAFRVDAANFIRIANKLDELLDQTTHESYKDMIDGSGNFFGSYNGKARSVNDGAAMDKWKAYATFLQDSVVRPFRELREKGRREAEPNR